MNQEQKLKIRLSEIRTAINELNVKEELSDDEIGQLDKLTKEARDKEARWRAACVAEALEIDKAKRDGTGEGAELRSLKAKARLGEYVRHATGALALDGAEAELNDALKIGIGSSGIRVPLEFLAAVEQRADVATTTAALDGGTEQRPILQRLFGRDVMSALGVRIDPVPEGMTEWPLITGGVDPAQTAEGTAKDAEAATFSTQTLRPRKLTARYLFTVEQAAQVPTIERALRDDLARAVSAEMNELIIGDGDGTGANITGILNRLADPADPSAVADFGAYVSSLSGAVDGIHASQESEVSMVMGVNTYRHAAGIIQDGSGESAVEALKRRARGVMASSFIAAPASNVQTALLHGGEGAGRGDSIAAMWPAMELIRDPYTAAASGQVALTWCVLWDCYMAFRAGAYKRIEFKLA